MHVPWAEVERVYAPVLSSASKPKLGNDKIYHLVARDLSFQNADWGQEPGGAPLMPFDDTDRPHNTSSIESLASFWVMDIDFANQNDASSVGICGLLSVGILQGTGPCTPICHKDGLTKAPDILIFQLYLKGFI